MYDDTVHYADAGSATLSIAGMSAPKIEPEIVFRLRGPVDAGTADAAGVLGSVEWVALGFEIIDCVFPDWKFQPADFVAAYGLHAALIVGTPLPVEPAIVPGARRGAPAVHREAAEQRRGRGRRIGKKFAAQPGVVSRRARRRDRASVGRRTARGRRPNQWGTLTASRLDRRRRTMECRRRGSGPCAIDPGAAPLGRAVFVSV